MPTQEDDDEDEDEEEWDEVVTAPAPDFEPFSIDDDFLADELDIVPDSEQPHEAEDEGEGVDDFLMGELEEEEETEPQQPAATAYSSFVAGSDDEDFSSSDSEDD